MASLPRLGEVVGRRRFSATTVELSLKFLVVVFLGAHGHVLDDHIHRIITRRAVENQPSVPLVDWNAAAQNTLQQILSIKQNENVARNVILFLGDGMGISTITAGRIYAGQLNGQTGEEYQLSFDKFPNVALAKTYNVNGQVPDSAGTATAFLCGVKANIGVIGVNQKVRRGVCDDMAKDTATSNGAQSIVRWSISEGKRTGIVTTTRITHATPSAGYAHSADRDWECDSTVPKESRYKPLCTDIASQLVTANSDINVLMGGGLNYFLPVNGTANGTTPTKGSRLDGRNLIEEWKARAAGKSSVFASNKAEFDSVDPSQTEFLLGLFNKNHLQYRIEQQEGGPPEPSLSDMTDKAIRILQRGPKGYFLLVEGGRIDHGHHANAAKLALEEMVGFDEAIKRALDMTNSSDTLIVVTADHSHVFAMGGYPSRGNPILSVVDPIGWQEQPSLDGLPYLTLMYTNGPGIGNRTNLTGVDTQANWFQQPVAVPLGVETHGGEDVAVFANGPMSHLFRGVFEQNYIAHALAYASCVGSNKMHCFSAKGGSSSNGLSNYWLVSVTATAAWSASVIATHATRP